jgi:FAD/FMN-containing dehydrogenase
MTEPFPHLAPPPTPTGCAQAPAGVAAAPIVLNDVHSRLHPTSVRRIVRPRDLDELCAAVRDTAASGRSLSISGGRHAMGGQPFARGSVHFDLRGLDRVLAFDRERGRVEVEAGIQWPALLAELEKRQPGRGPRWGIAQKQTGADRLTLGGSLAANIHGRGLAMAPFVNDVEAFTLLGADGMLRHCSRSRSPHLFSLVAGGYGLFGPVHSITLRLVQRRRLRREVEIVDAGSVVERLERRRDEGCLYGDFQFDIDSESADFLRRGVLSCYRPVPVAGPVPEGQRTLSERDWGELIILAHTDKTAAFERYAEHYLATHGQLYDSDAHQLGVYLDGYHEALDRRLGAPVPGSEVITELYVPRARLAELLAAAAGDLRRHQSDLIYGTVRLIERDRDSFLAWAREPWACVVFNLHVDHDDRGLERAAAAFRRLVDRALERGGSFYLTYHRWATRRQVELAHPRFRDFLRFKRRLDPGELFQSEWHRHYRRLFAEEGSGDEVEE